MWIDENKFIVMVLISFIELKICSKIQFQTTNDIILNDSYYRNREYIINMYIIIYYYLSLMYTIIDLRDQE